MKKKKNKVYQDVNDEGIQVEFFLKVYNKT